MPASRNIFFSNSHSRHLELGAEKGGHCHCQMAEKKSGLREVSGVYPMSHNWNPGLFLSQPVFRAPSTPFSLPMALCFYEP